MRAAHDGRLPIEWVDASVRRIMAVKTRYSVGLATHSGLGAIQSPEHFRLIAALYAAVADRREQEQSFDTEVGFSRHWVATAGQSEARWALWKITKVGRGRAEVRSRPMRGASARHPDLE